MLKTIQNILLFLLVFSLGFEYWDPFGLSGFASISKIIFAVYAISLMPNITYFLIPHFKTSIITELFLWLGLYAIVTVVYLPIGGNFTTSLDSTFFNIILFIIITNHLIRNGRPLLKLVLISIACIPILQYLLIINNIGLSLGDEGRLFFFGDNPNNIGIISALALLISMVLLFDNFLQLSKKRFLLLISMTASIFIIIATGSRGAIIAVALGLILFLLLRKLPLSRKLLFSLLILIGFYYFYDMIEKSEIMSHRMLTLFKEGDESRMNIYRDISTFAYDSPIWGLGESGYHTKITQYMGDYKSSHNGFLDLYLYTGIIGFFLFSFVLLTILKFCWSLHKKHNISMAMMLFIVVLFNFGKSGGGWNSKIMWLIFSIVIAMYYIINNQTKKRIQE